MFRDHLLEHDKGTPVAPFGITYSHTVPVASAGRS